LADLLLLGGHAVFFGRIVHPSEPKVNYYMMKALSIELPLG
jgi:hypothetical protein